MQMLDYNVPGGKLNRGMAVGDILLHLTKDVRIFPTFCSSTQLPALWINAAGPHLAFRSCSNLIRICYTCKLPLLYWNNILAYDIWMHVQVSEQQIFEANVLGWCIEWVSLP